MVVGYSGGADSTCLIHLLARGKRNPIAAHLNHGQRPESEEEARKCAEFCQALGVSYAPGHADVPALAVERRVGIEEAGRIARYTFLHQVAQQFGAVRVATAHTLTDHVETVLLHIIRGSGRRGLGGIAAESGDLIRPMLAFDRETTRAYCKHHGLWFHDDPANVDDRHARSRLRNRVFPVLKELNPSIEEALARLAGVMREEDVFLDGAAAATLEQLETPLNGPLGILTRHLEIALDLDHIRHYPQALVRRGIRLCFETLGAELDHHQTALVLDGMLGGVKGSITAAGGVVAADWDHRRVHFFRHHKAVAVDTALEVPGRVEAAELGWAVTAEAAEHDGATQERASLAAFIDGDRVSRPLNVRTHRAGDRIQPLGAKGSRKLSDLFGEAHLTVLARQRVPIVCDAQGPVWCPGIALSERVATTDASSCAWRLDFHPAGDSLQSVM